MGERVMPYLKLDASWKTRVIAALKTQEPNKQDQNQHERLDRALQNLRKQHLWGDLSDETYQRERETLNRQLKLTNGPDQPTRLPNLKRSARHLEDLQTRWHHPEVTHEQRENLVREVFHRSTIDGKDIVSIEPKTAYAPLFASIVTDQKFGYWESESPPSPPETQISRLRLPVSLGRFVYQDHVATLPGGRDLEEGLERRLGPDGHDGLFLDGVHVDRVQHGQKELSPLGPVGIFQHSWEVL